jgi:hypothetical protein
MCDGALLERFEPTTRDSDVFVATAAKSGQTWLLALLFHLKTRGRSPDYGGEGLLRQTPWLELPYDVTTREPWDHDERMEMLEALDDPRIFKMHVIWPEIPRPGGSKARIITVTRDPRDLPYSMFRHLAGMKGDWPGKPATDDFDAYFEHWFDYGYVFRFLESFWPHYDDEDVLWLRYEDMQEDLEREARKIVAFLGWNVDDDDLARVLPLVDFEQMQKSEKKQIMSEGTSRWKEDAQFFREGGVGKNRARLSAEQEARIVDRAKETLPAECVEFVFAQGL